MADATVDGDWTTIEDILEDLDDVAADASSETIREEVRDTKAALLQAHGQGMLDSRQRVLDARDAAEAFVGSVIFASPLLVEDGIFDIGQHLFTNQPGGAPVFLIANTAFVLVMTYALLEWTGRNTEELRTLFGLPVRVVMILLVSFLVAALLMTVWGRVDLLGRPIQALARINVLWTVGSLGAALGDILSESTTDPTATDAGPAVPRETDLDRETTPDSVLAAIYDRFDDLEESVGDESRREIRRLRERTVEAAVDDFDAQISKYTGRDIAEAFVGSVFFSIPFLVEDGVFEVAAYFLSFRLGQFPVYFLVNAAFILGMVALLVYWAGPREVQISRPLFGVVPRRLVGISVVSFLTAAALMTMWGRIAVWADPVGSVARISVVWTVASFGASLGDVLPGESSGDDINDELADLSDQVEELFES